MLPIASLPAQDVITAAMPYFDYNYDFYLQRDFKTNLEMIYTLEIKKYILCEWTQLSYKLTVNIFHGVEKNIK